MAQKKKTVSKAKTSTVKKKAEAKVSKLKKTEVVKSEEMTSKSAPVQFTIKRSTMIKTLVGIVIALLLVPVVDFVIQTSITSKYVAFNNGHNVTRKEYLESLEESYGEDNAMGLIVFSMIDMGAEEKGVEVSDEEIDASIQELMDQNGIATEEELYAELEANGYSKDRVLKETKAFLLLNKIVEDDVAPITDAEIEDYFAQNKDTLYEGQKYEDVKASIKTSLESASIEQKGQEWLGVQMETYDTENLLVTKESKSYKFLKSIDLLKKLFPKKD